MRTNVRYFVEHFMPFPLQDVRKVWYDGYAKDITIEGVYKR